MWLTASKRGPIHLGFDFETESVLHDLDTGEFRTTEDGLFGVGVVGREGADPMDDDDDSEDRYPGDHFFSFAIPLLPEPIPRSKIREHDSWADSEISKVPHMRNPVVVTVEE